jgi:uncharacterized protein (TIGR01777 family)
MKIIIAGGSGFLGRPLTSRLAADGHEIVILTRTPAGLGGGVRAVVWAPDGTAGPWAAEIDGADAVVNLAGESIAGQRWSPAHKQRVLDSRVRATRSLVAAIIGAAHPPTVFVSASGVGYYGPRADEILTEAEPPGNDFLAGVCVRWEAEASRAASASTRVVCVRTGLALARDGGALPQMLLPFKMGAGGPVGSGRQYWPWIHRSDWVDMVRWALQTRAVSGPLNATAPNPVTNKDFARALGRALRRPSLMPAPAFALRLVLGEMADALLLSGQRAVPAKAQALGFTFKYTRLEPALADIFRPA